MELAEKLKELRQLKGMTLRKLSEKACVSYSIMNAIENGRFRPTKEIIISIAYALKCEDVESLLLLSGYEAAEAENN